MKIGRKDHENNENWGISEIKKVVCKTARRAHSQKCVGRFFLKISKKTMPCM